MRFSGRGQQTGVRKLAAFAARWLIDGSVIARGRRAWAWGRRSVAGIGLPVSPDRRERRESSSCSPVAPACAGPDGRAARRGLSGVFRRLGLPATRRTDGGVASAALSGDGTGRRDPGGLRARSLAARGLAAVLLATFAALLALPLQAQAQTTVPHDWSLIPSGLGPGDNFRLLFLSSTKRNASSTAIGTYNTFIQDLAAVGHADIQAYKSDFKVVGCTNSRSAKANTNTRTSDTDAPIYWLGGS